MSLNRTAGRLRVQFSFIIMAGVRLALVFLAATELCALHLPSYIIPCRRDDPEISKCVREHGNAVIPHLRKGDKRYNFPALDPLKISSASIVTGQNLQLTLTNISVYGLDAMKITDSMFYPKTLTSKITLHADKVTVLADYEVNGNILLLPISGVGPAEMTFVQPSFNLTWVMGTRRDTKGDTFLTCADASVKYNLQGASYKIDNLFNGNKELGDQMNKVINENWRVLNDEFSPALCAVIVKVTRQIGENVLATVPMKEIFI